MSGRPETSADEAKRWLGWACEDLTLAEHAAADPGVVPRGACVWAHQAAEKALKALVIAEGTNPPRVHDLTRLARMLDEAVQARLEVMALAELTHWAIERRYPSDIAQASAEDVKAALDTARAVLKVSSGVLGSRPAEDSG